MRAQRIDRHAKLELRTAIGGHESAIGGEHGDAFDDGANEFGSGMEVDANLSREHIREHVVLNHLRGHPRQCHRVLVIATVITRDVQRANHIAMRVQDGGA